MGFDNIRWAGWNLVAALTTARARSSGGLLAAALSGCADDQAATVPRPSEDEFRATAREYCTLHVRCIDRYGGHFTPEPDFVEECVEERVDQQYSTPAPCVRSLLNFYQCMLDLEEVDPKLGCSITSEGELPRECGDVAMAVVYACPPTLPGFV